MLVHYITLGYTRQSSEVNRSIHRRSDSSNDRFVVGVVSSSLDARVLDSFKWSGWSGSSKAWPRYDIRQETNDYEEVYNRRPSDRNQDGGVRYWKQKIKSPWKEGSVGLIEDWLRAWRSVWLIEGAALLDWLRAWLCLIDWWRGSVGLIEGVALLDWII